MTPCKEKRGKRGAGEESFSRKVPPRPPKTFHGENAWSVRNDPLAPALVEACPPASAVVVNRQKLPIFHPEVSMTSHAETRGLVFNIQKYSVHDGPGIRTLVFFKGCPLRCRWCSNPESQALRVELGYNADKCLGCSACARACGRGALSLTPHGVVLDKTICPLGEGRREEGGASGGRPPCVRACPAQALNVYGVWRTVDDVLAEVEADNVFYARSGGGLTLSGGEALAQPGFALALLREAKKRRIHRALETCSLVPREVLLEACNLLNYVLMDVKCLDADKHKAFTGVGNERILSNIRAVRKACPQLPMHIRTPVIPGFNDTPDDIRGIAAFARDIGATRCELLPYHRMGEQKYRFLGLDYPMGEASLDETAFARLQAMAHAAGPDEKQGVKRLASGNRRWGPNRP